jgi:LacI family transcriptional regulator
MPKKITIYDVAKKAGVAISTVSRVLNGSPYVSDDTKDKVQRAIADLEFHPQVNARKLASREPQLVAVAVPTFTTPFFNEVLKGVKDQIKNLDIDFIIYDTGSSDPETNFKKFLDRGTPDALIAFSIEIDEEIHQRLKKMHVPIIIVGSEHPSYNYYVWDNYKGGYLAAEHLMQRGFKNIGMIRAHSKSPITDLREKGFRDALEKAGMPIREENIVSGITQKHAGYSEEAGFEAINILKERNALPEAIFCSNDAQAIGAIYAIRQMGLSVPEDVAIIGYDNIKMSKYLDLTSIDQKMYDVGAKAVQRLAYLIKNPDSTPIQEKIEPTLVVRKSSEKKA